MDAQINKMAVQMEKIQEMFKKDLEQIKTRQSTMNNVITEIKNTVETTNSRILRQKSG